MVTVEVQEERKKVKRMKELTETAKQSEDRKLPRKETPAKKETPRKVESKQAEVKDNKYNIKK